MHKYFHKRKIRRVLCSLDNGAKSFSVDLSRVQISFPPKVIALNLISKQNYMWPARTEGNACEKVKIAWCFCCQVWKLHFLFKFVTLFSILPSRFITISSYFSENSLAWKKNLVSTQSPRKERFLVKCENSVKSNVVTALVCPLFVLL